MGSIVSAACKCGFNKKMALGGGRANFQTNASFPMHCGDCESLFMANALDMPVACSDCSSSKVLLYSHQSLFKNGHQTVFKWKTGDALKLTNGDYLCPICHEFELKFSHVGYWD